MGDLLVFVKYTQYPSPGLELELGFCYSTQGPQHFRNA